MSKQGLGGLQAMVEARKALEASKARTGAYRLRRSLALHFAQWRKHHSRGEFRRLREARQQRKTFLLKKYLRGFTKLTAYRRSQRVLRVLKAERWGASLFYSWRQLAVKGKTQRLKVKQAKRAKKLRLLHGWMGLAERTRKIRKLQARTDSRMRGARLSTAMRALARDFAVRKECEERLGSFLKDKAEAFQSCLLSCWVHFTARRITLRTKAAVVQGEQQKRSKQHFLFTWRRRWNENLLVAQCALGRSEAVQRQCFVEWKLGTVEARARRQMEREAEGIYAARLKNVAMQALAYYMNCQQQGLFKKRMAHAHFAQVATGKTFNAIFYYAQARARKAAGLETGARHFLQRLAFRVLRLWRRRVNLLKLKRSGPLPLLRKHLARFVEGIAELRERRSRQEVLDARGEDLFVSKAQRASLGVLRENVQVRRVVKRELKVAAQFQRKQWLEKLRAATTTHRQLRGLIASTSAEKENSACLFFK